jgi:hypothetical protein
MQKHSWRAILFSHVMRDVHVPAAGAAAAGAPNVTDLDGAASNGAGAGAGAWAGTGAEARVGAAHGTRSNGATGHTTQSERQQTCLQK